MPAANPDGALPQRGDVQSAAQAYIAAGLSIIPVRPNKSPYTTVIPKAVGGQERSWKAAYAESARATLADVDSWLSAAPDVGLGIIAGASTTKMGCMLVALDVDDAGFSTWLETHLVEHLLQRTWTVKTASGKLHVYLWSRLPANTHSLVALSKKSAEVRAEGPSYLVAPPTWADYTKDGVHIEGFYQTLYGDPQAIRVVENASDVFQKINDWYAGQFTTTYSTPSTNKRIIAPCDNTGRNLLITKMAQTKVDPRIRRTIINGGDPGSGDWPRAGSNSDIDYGVCIHLLRSGWSYTEIEQVYATFEIGGATYRNTERPMHGYAYLIDYTVKNAIQELERSKAAALIAKGADFEVIEVTRVDYEEHPVYRANLRLQDGRSGWVRLLHPDLMSAGKFRAAVLRDMGFVPEFQPAHKGPNFYKLGKLIADMAQTEDVPEAASTVGYLRMTIKKLLRELRKEKPREAAELVFGWQDLESGYALFRQGKLMERIGAQIRPLPTAEQVWATLKTLGGRQEMIKVGGVREPLVAVPLTALR